MSLDFYCRDAEYFKGTWSWPTSSTAAATTWHHLQSRVVSFHKRFRVKRFSSLFRTEWLSKIHSVKCGIPPCLVRKPAVDSAPRVTRHFKRTHIIFMCFCPRIVLRLPGNGISKTVLLSCRATSGGCCLFLQWNHTNVHTENMAPEAGYGGSAVIHMDCYWN